MIKVMSLGSNCLGLTYLGNYRVRGPVDNWLAIHGFEDVFRLFTDFEDQIKRGFNSSAKRENYGKGDSDTVYIYDSHKCYHLDMKDPEIEKKVLQRLENLKSHLLSVRADKECYFSYNLSRHDVYLRDKKWFLKDSVLEKIRDINKVFPSSKLIIVGTPTKRIDPNFNVYLDERPKDINYVDIHDIVWIQRDKNQVLKNQREFSNYINKLVKPDPPKQKKKVVPVRKILFNDDWDD